VNQWCTWRLLEASYFLVQAFARAHCAITDSGSFTGRKAAQEPPPPRVPWRSQRRAQDGAVLRCWTAICLDRAGVRQARQPAWFPFTRDHFQACLMRHRHTDPTCDYSHCRRRTSRRDGPAATADFRGDVLLSAGALPRSSDPFPFSSRTTRASSTSHRRRLHRRQPRGHPAPPARPGPLGLRARSRQTTRSFKGFAARPEKSTDGCVPTIFCCLARWMPSPDSSLNIRR